MDNFEPVAQQVENTFPKSLQSIINGLPAQIKFVSASSTNNNNSKSEVIEIDLRAGTNDNLVGKAIISKCNGNISFESGNDGEVNKWFEIVNKVEAENKGLRTFTVYTANNNEVKLGSLIEPTVKNGQITNRDDIVLNNDYEKDEYSIVVVSSEDIWINRNDGPSICKTKLQPYSVSLNFESRLQQQPDDEPVVSIISIRNATVSFLKQLQIDWKPTSVIEKCLCLSTAIVLMMGGSKIKSEKVVEKQAAADKVKKTIKIGEGAPEKKPAKPSLAPILHTATKVNRFGTEFGVVKSNEGTNKKSLN